MDGKVEEVHGKSKAAAAAVTSAITQKAPNQILKERTLLELRNSIRLSDLFRYILSFDTESEALQALKLAKTWRFKGSTLYYRHICLTRDSKWKLYISNQKLQTYSILT